MVLWYDISLRKDNFIFINKVFSFSQIKLKIQNEKLNPYPDTFSLDWENLSENELKRLVVQLEKTR